MTNALTHCHLNLWWYWYHQMPCCRKLSVRSGVWFLLINTSVFQTMWLSWQTSFWSRDCRKVASWDLHLQHFLFFFMFSFSFPFISPCLSVHDLHSSKLASCIFPSSGTMTHLTYTSSFDPTSLSPQDSSQTPWDPPGGVRSNKVERRLVTMSRWTPWSWWGRGLCYAASYRFEDARQEGIRVGRESPSPVADKLQSSWLVLQSYTSIST